MRMRMPVVVVTGESDTDGVADVLLGSATTTRVEHRFDGHVVHRSTTVVSHGVPVVEDAVLELTRWCVSCTVREDLIGHVARLHRRPDVDRTVVRLGPWMEPEPVCFVLDHSQAARDVTVAAVVTAVDTTTWLTQALGDTELDDGRACPRRHPRRAGRRAAHRR